MTHAVVLVFLQGKTLEKAMQPFDEANEKNFTFQLLHKKDQFKEDAEKILAEVREIAKTRNIDLATYEEMFTYGKYEDIFVAWEGGDVNEDGDWGYFNNSEAKWDWYTIGGRWTKRVLITRDGKPEDWAKVKDVDWELIKQRRHDANVAEWDNVAAILKKHGMDITEFYALSVDERGKFMDAKLHDEEGNDFFDVAFFEIQGTKTKEEWLTKQDSQGLSWAFLDHEGHWCEKALMGWWGTHGDINATYGETFWKYLESVDPETMVYAVDYHI